MSEKSDIAQETRRQFITFVSGEQEFGANIMTIREIRGWTETTLLPHAPDYVRGVINLRGVVLPVVDLKARLGRGITEAVRSLSSSLSSPASARSACLWMPSRIFSRRLHPIFNQLPSSRKSHSSFVDGIAVLDKRMVTLLSMERLTASLVGESLPAAEAA